MSVNGVHPDRAGHAVCVFGGNGRFGSRILSVLWESGIAAYPSGAESARPPTAIVDVSSPSALDTLTATARRTRAGVVSCVSGTPPEHRAQLRALAAAVPVVTVDNASVGSHLQMAVARALAESPVLREYEVSFTVIDRHPVTKKDAPSATATRIADLLRPIVGAVAVRSERYGDPVADHTLVLEFGSETLRVEHAVSSLDNSARQVAKLALLVPALPPALYSISDIYERFGSELPKLPQVANPA
jgi:4-hydroxy-tetrahydrodipicolinate reductase